ncbi:hypothetical protein [Paenibacillus ginsengarvi]|uniref:Isochorismatase family protein n=1 Tax=Paenibacillus ginsengarvi TaxID=400777 RepID=A0A3B0CID4_9BACL|nr:hypothetical protein [Paenibacillus ginsengarvi]RKN84047.1 hypothetical protein D7M11_15870 [Paenibacillus ginsengarvi]
MGEMHVPTWYYQQYDADFALDVPAEGFGGWRTSVLPMSLDTTALIVMHAWDCGTREQYAGWHRVVEYIPRSYDICDRVMPGLLTAARSAGMTVYHVVRPGSGYFRDYPGYERAVRLAGPEQPKTRRVEYDETFRRLSAFRAASVFPGDHNRADIAAGQSRMDFPAAARPAKDEGIAESSAQLHALCRADGINHLVYAGFAINGCLQTSPGGMVDMQREGYMCSAIRQAVTAIENKETARAETAKEIALWQVALLYGFVYDAGDLAAALNAHTGPAAAP